MLLSHLYRWRLTPAKRSFSLVVLSGMVVSAMSVVSQSPALADGVVVRGGSVTVQVGELEPPRAIYSRSDDWNDRDRYWGDRGSRRGDRSEIDDSVLVNPVIIDSSIEDSLLIDPVIIDSSGYDHGNVHIYSPQQTRPTCQVLSNFRAACR